jgi:hypothetical protein
MNALPEFTDLLVNPSDKAKEWRRLHAEAKEAFDAMEVAERESQQAKNGVQIASDAYKAALKEKAGKAKVEKLEGDLAAAKARAAEPWQERYDVARTDFDDARNAASRFAAAEADDLIVDDLVPLTLEAVEQRKRAAAALLDAMEFERKVERRMTDVIIHKPGVYPKDVLPYVQIDAEIERSILKAIDLPARLPRAMSA